MRSTNHFFRLSVAFILCGFIISVGLSGCGLNERTPRVFIEYGTPPRFIVSGPGTLNNFDIIGPDLERDTANRQGDQVDRLFPMKTYWELAPGETAKKLDDIGVIVYVQVPPGLIQVYPKNGPPPPLVDRDLYNVSLSPKDDYPFNTFFAIRTVGS